MNDFEELRRKHQVLERAFVEQEKELAGARSDYKYAWTQLNEVTAKLNDAETKLMKFNMFISAMWAIPRPLNDAESDILLEIGSIING